MLTRLKREKSRSTSKRSMVILYPHQSYNDGRRRLHELAVQFIVGIIHLRVLVRMFIRKPLTSDRETIKRCLTAPPVHCRNRFSKRTFDDLEIFFLDATSVYLLIFAVLLISMSNAPRGFLGAYRLSSAKATEKPSLAPEFQPRGLFLNSITDYCSQPALQR